MRLLKVLAIVSVACVAQSCKIEMPPLIALIGSHSSASYGWQKEPHLRRPSAHHFGYSSRAIQYLGFKDTLLILDHYLLRDDYDSRQYNNHAESIHTIMTGVGIPGDQALVRFYQEFFGSAYTSEEWRELRRATRVMHMPLAFPLHREEHISKVAESNTVFVLGAGNMSVLKQIENLQGDRDVYNSNHVVWKQHPKGQEWYQNILEVYKTGKVIAAISAIITPHQEWSAIPIPLSMERTIEPHKGIFTCGDIKEACFTTIPVEATSFASARLASMAFYLAQFYPRAEEVVETLEKCAVDIGEPGIDREYGREVANLLCPPVLKKELAVVSQYVEEKKKGEKGKGGVLEGEWSAEGLEVYLPPVLQETLQFQYEGKAEGTAIFEENKATLAVSLTASVIIRFLLAKPIEAKAEEEIQGEGVYATEGNTLTIQTSEPLQYTYTATEDSLKLIRSLTLNEVLRFLPGAFKKLVEEETEDWFQDDPIQIITTFTKVPLLVGDFDGNSIVDFTDFLLFTQVFGATIGDQAFNKDMDLIPDGMINFADFLVFVENFGASG